MFLVGAEPVTAADERLPKLNPPPITQNVERYENKYKLYELTQVQKAVPKTVCE